MMAKARDTEAAQRSIGLATEHRLPPAFKARTDSEAGTVEIKRSSGRSLDVAINSFASVANVLAVFSPEGEATLKPEHTIRVVDDFTGREVTITANTFIDVATAFGIFVVERGRYLPALQSGDDASAESKAVEQGATAPEAEVSSTAPSATETPASKPAEDREADEPAAKVTKKSAAKTTAKAPGKKSAKAKSAGAAKAAPKEKAEAEAKTVAAPSTKANTTAKEDTKASSSAGKADVSFIPPWAEGLPREHDDESGQFKLVARTLALTKEKAKTVEGIATAKSKFPAFGYEVVQGKRRVGWVIVEDAKSWIVTGFGEIAPSKHANLTAATIRIRITNLPQVG